MLRQVEIRKATIKDVAILVEMEKYIADQHYKIDPTTYDSGTKVTRASKKNITAAINSKQERILIVALEDQGVGFIWGQIKKVNNQKIGHISSAYTEKDFRKLGLMQVAFDELLEWFKLQKIHRITLNVHSKNIPGIKTWGKLGFKEYMKRMKLEI